MRDIEQQKRKTGNQYNTNVKLSMKQLLSILFTITLLCTAGAFAEGPGGFGGRGGYGDGSGALSK